MYFLDDGFSYKKVCLGIVDIAVPLAMFFFIIILLLDHYFCHTHYTS